MSDLSPQSTPKQTLMIQIVVTNRDFMSTRLARDAINLGQILG
jgi:hypothetical protein